MDLRDVWPNCTKFGKDINQWWLKCDLSPKSRPNFRHFTPVKVTRCTGKMSKCHFQLQPTTVINLWYTDDRGSTWRAGRSALVKNIFKKIKKMTAAMHCNLMLPNIMSVVFPFKYDAHTKYKVGQSIRSWLIMSLLLTPYLILLPWPLTLGPWTFAAYPL